MAPNEFVVTKIVIGDTIMTLTSEKYQHEILDTKVKIGDETICSISGLQIGQFVEELKALIQKYRI